MKNTGGVFITCISYFILVFIFLECPSYEGQRMLYKHLLFASKKARKDMESLKTFFVFSWCRHPQDGQACSPAVSQSHGGLRQKRTGNSKECWVWGFLSKLLLFCSPAYSSINPQTTWISSYTLFYSSDSASKASSAALMAVLWDTQATFLCLP